MRRSALILIIPILVLKMTSGSGRRTAASNSNNLSWDSTKNWKIYKVSNFARIFQVPIDSLQEFKSRPLSDDSMHLFLSNVRQLRSEGPVWMGCYLASYEAGDGKLEKAIISHYAGFFYCQLEGTYFQVNFSVQQDWLNYLSSSFMAIDSSHSALPSTSAGRR